MTRSTIATFPLITTACRQVGVISCVIRGPILVCLLCSVLVSTGCSPKTYPENTEESELQKQVDEANSWEPLIETDAPVPLDKVRFATRKGYVVMRKLNESELELFLKNVNFGEGWFSSNGEIRARDIPPVHHYEIHSSYYCTFKQRDNQTCFNLYIDDKGRYFLAEKDHPVSRSASYLIVQRRNHADTVHP